MPPRRRRRTSASSSAGGMTEGNESVEEEEGAGRGSQQQVSQPQTRQQSQAQQRRTMPTRAQQQATRPASEDGGDEARPTSTGVAGDSNGRAERNAADSDNEDDDPDHIKIMLATDNHVGYMEKDPVRGRDSINTFREILQLAVEHDVDFVLLGGDLFHENRPSRTAMHQVMGALREFTLGSKPVSIELLSDPNDGQAEGYDFPAINYEDSNLNVAIPVFSIHGNHDDPQGIGAEGALSAVDLLSVTGLTNYFGKVELPSSDALAKRQASQAPSKGGLSDVGIRIRPILLRKGATKIALYGMGNIKDERMHYELRNNRVRMYRPSEDPDGWFNILAIHQNRVGHDPKAVVPETMFDDSVHLVVWGHEHEQRLNPEPVAGKRYHISQPGSSVATSLMPGEAVDKKVGIIHVHGRDFRVEPLTLKTVRPFVEDSLDLDELLQDEGISIEEKPQVVKLLKGKVQELIDFANRQWEKKYAESSLVDRPDKMLPLIRLRVHYTRMDAGTLVRFGQDFVNKVANPKDLLQFAKKKAIGTRRTNERGEFNDPDAGMVPSEKLEKTRMSDLTQTYLKAQTLQILDPSALDRSVLNFVDKDDKDAIPHFVKRGLTSIKSSLATKSSDESRMMAELDRIRESRNRAAEDDNHNDSDQGAERAAETRHDQSDEEDALFGRAMDDDFEPPKRGKRADSPQKRTQGARSTARLRATPLGAAGAGSPSQRTLVFRGNSDSEADNDSDVVEPHPPPVVSTARGGSRSAATSLTAKKPNTGSGTGAGVFGATRRSGSRAAAQRASSRFVESQAQDDNEDDDFEMSFD